MRGRSASEQPVKAQRAARPKARKPQAALESTTDFQEQVAALKRELKEAREQQTATSEVLQVISRSPGELGQIFQTMLEKAVQVCGAKFGILFLSEADGFRTTAMHNVPRAFAEKRAREPFLRPTAGTPLGRVMRTRQVAHIADITTEQGYADGHRPLIDLAELGGARTAVCVPMLNDNELVGAITIYQKEVRPFSDKQIELLTNFAAQAVIAIENARLLNEQRESLERQTATSEVLQVISSSPGELGPVFNAILTNATRICEAKFANLFFYGDNSFRIAAQQDPPPAYAERWRNNPVLAVSDNPRNPLTRLATTKSIVNIIDVMAEPGYIERDPRFVALVESAGARTHLLVPMVKHDQLVGAIAIYRQEVRPFTEKQIELVTNFAKQAVIAIENARLLNELRQRTNDLSESLEQQTATSEVLKVISSSPGELHSIFQAVLENAVRICTAKFGGLVLFEGDAYRRVALHNAPAEYLEEQARDPVRPLATSPTLSRVARTKQVIHIADICAEQPEEAIATLGGARTILCVPMLKDERVVGVISIYRHEVRPFTDKQAELVANFAKQAVIAIENTRLLNELRERTDDLSESLEQQTATSEVLKVISSSPGDLEPVFTAMLENATRVCEAKHGFLFRTERNGFRVAAALGDRTAFIEQMRSRAIKPGPLTPIGRLGLTRQIVHVPDLSKDRAYLERDPLVVTAVEQGDVRSVLVVPMIKDGELIGAIGMHRRDVRPFTDKQIELLTNFASQAVIAIENTRLLNELRQRTDDLAESLEQQTATSDVLQVVSSSPGELGPVFEAMLANAVRICRASFGVLFRFEEGSTRAVAMLGVPPAFAEFWQRGPQRPGPRTALGRVIETKQTIHITDVKAEPAYVEGEPVFVAAVNLGGFRSLINVPMLKENELIGTIAIYRQEVKPFTDKEIALVQNFAAQAVIAIENTRLLNELRESLQQQTATSEVLKVISGSSGKLEPVFDAMLENATRICEATYGAMWLRQDGSLRNVAFYGALPAAFSKLWKAGSEISVASGAPVARAVRSGKTIIVSDLKDDAGYRERDHLVVGAVDLGGIRTLIAVPMLKDGEHVGAITIYHREVRPFTEKQIELVQNFAAQAVIAIENTRLLNELRESLQQQTATADVLRVISSSPGDLEPVFQAMLEKATLICEAKFGVMFLYENGSFHTRAMCGVPHALVEERQRNPVVRPSPGTGVGRVLRTKKTVHIADVLMEPEYVNIPEGFTKPGIVQFHGARTELAVPMLKDDELVGTIVIYRTEVRPFTDKQIELVTNFAAQAVIAIENTRLLSELRTRTNELAQSVSELQALGEVSQAVNSTLDLETVLTTIVRRAVELSRTDAGAIYVFNEQREEFRLHATHGMSETMIAAIGSQHIGLGDGNNIATATTERRPVQVADTRDEPASAVNDIVLREGYRSILVIPLLRPDHIVGALVVRRKTPGDFPQSAIELLQTFADQSVVAIQNARLYENVETRTRQLAQSLDDLRTAQDRLVQTQKLASLGQLTAGIAHEIKNPLNFVNNFSVVSSELIDELQQTLKGIPFDDKARAEINDLTTTLRGNLDKVVQHGKRADAIVKNMLLHSREGSGEHRPVDINALVEESLSLAYHGARAEKQGFNITLQRSFDPAAEQADVFPQDITRVLLNLILNGFYAATKRKAEVDSDAYEPTLAVSTHSLGDRVEITVRDNGTGISPEVKEKMFNPFFTTKPAGAGTGLGLSISHDIVVKQHGGSIEVETEPGEYTEFRIILPRAGAFVTTSGAQS